MEVDPAKVEELRALPENQARLAKIDELGVKVKEMKEAGEDGKKVEDVVAEMLAVKDELPLELLNERDRKKKLKKMAAEEKKKEKEARAAKWAAQAKGDGSKKKKKKPPTSTQVFVNKTPPGEKKDLSGPMAQSYDPPAVESAWDAWWEKSGFYSADADEVSKAPEEDKFVMVIPPPNVTGSLHIGHALTCAIEDTLCRWHRMVGKHVMWLPGTDHAGIATQAVVEKKLMREEQKTKHDLGREAFLEKVWEWKNASGARILTQLRRLGASVDHSRTAFTMDEVRSRAVTEAFVRMFDDKLIYRDTRLVNWSHALNTALSDIEVDHEDLKGLTLRSVKGHDPDKKYEFGTLTSFAYKIADADGNPTDDEVVVATTRLETMLGDTAVAVNPADERYTKYHGKQVVHPFRNCTIPIITDAELVDMSFGTGAVKITPAHDPNDFKCGRKHGLAELSILNDDGSINGICGPKFEGMMRYDARYFVEDELKALGLFRDKQSHEMQIPICSRSGDVIEPRLKPQWWVSCDKMAASAVAKVRSKELQLIPEFHERTWFAWLENIQDWCISRQLWWGHRIPAYKVTKGAPAADAGAEEKWYVGRNEDEARARAAADLGVDGASLELAQDPDVLDTWFSSGLFPFSTLQWPSESAEAEKEQKAFFPGTLLETGHDILFFWVARMVMMSLQLRDTLPFKTVYLHAMVRDKYGRKMSKSLGNVIDPISVIEGISLEALHETLMSGNLPEKEIAKAREGQKLDYPEGIPQCGADALRFGLLAYTQQGRDVNLDINVVAAHRRFCNKLWQVTKFMMLNLGDSFSPSATFLQDVAAKKVELAFRDRWILSCLGECAQGCNEAMEGFDFAKATTALHSFYLDCLCDVYVEAVKPVMYAADREGASEASLSARNVARNVLWWCLDVAFRLMHPIMPFISEELWQRLPGRPQPAPPSIMVAHYPGAKAFAKHAKDPAAQAETDAVLALRDKEAKEFFDIVNTVSHAMRSLASDFNVASNRGLEYTIKVSNDPHRRGLLQAGQSDLEVLGKAKSVSVVDETAEPPTGSAASLPDPQIQVFLSLKGIVDPAKELDKLAKDLAKAEKKLATLQERIDGPNFSKMKPEGQTKTLEQRDAEVAKIASTKEQQTMFEAYAAELAG
ncbi:Valine--tRNA ligase (Protein G7a) (Valyl-tRNA synthetase) (ValRS) [Durusdinium trenchii]|uniref:valine--tRNA ligase n=1 Tax=Durusdinium trenchii TaxID=1381693 RepID=A0ABP0IHI5_9DINO